MKAPLAGRVAVVTGASRGIGKGIALELGAAGATVYVTGRTVEAGPAPPAGDGRRDRGRDVERSAGAGVAVACDHHDDAAVEALFARVASEQGGLDVLVNNVYSSFDFAQYLGKPFWELPLDAWDEVIDIGARSHYVAARFGVPLMFARGGGLVVNVTSSGAVQYAHTVTYGVGKAAVDKMTADMAHELVGSRRRGGFGVARARAHRAGGARRASRPTTGAPCSTCPARAPSISPTPSRRGSPDAAVVALATDPDVMKRSGQAFAVGQLAAEYDFTDVDGTRTGVRLRREGPRAR